MLALFVDRYNDRLDRWEVEDKCIGVYDSDDKAIEAIKNFKHEPNKTYYYYVEELTMNMRRRYTDAATHIITIRRNGEMVIE